MACRSFRSWLDLQATSDHPYTHRAFARVVQVDLNSGCLRGSVTPTSLRKHMREVHRATAEHLNMLSSAVQAWRECRL
jgi:hypothetical protein